MKKCRLIASYFQGIRFPAIFLSVIMCLTVFFGVNVISRIRYTVNDYTIVRNNRLGKAYFVEKTYLSPEELMHPEVLDANITEVSAALYENPAVEHVYTIRLAVHLKYSGQGISITLLDPELLRAFPELVKQGLDFSVNPDGCILGSKLFRGVKAVDAIPLQFYDENKTILEFPVAGHIDPPYKHPTLDSSGTSPRASLLLRTGDVVIMQDTQNVLDRLEGLTPIHYNTNLIVSFREDASDEAIAAVLDSLDSFGLAVPIDEMIARTETDIAESLRKDLPIPLFLLFSETIAYLSTVLLCIKKKERELSVYYLCGANRRQCMVVAFSANCLIALPTLILNTLFAVLAPHLDWSGVIDLNHMAISSEVYLLILGYFLLTVMISALSTYCSMAKHSPLSYLRGVES